MDNLNASARPLFLPAPERNPDDVLWMMELDGDQRPERACLVVHEDGDHIRTACGQMVSRMSIGRGWWLCRPGRLPLQRQWIHCGLDDNTR